MDWRSYWECVDQEPRNLDESRSYRDSIEKKGWEAVKMLSRRQRAQENSSMNQESVEDPSRKEKEKLDRKESVEDLLRSCWAWRKGVFKGGKT